MFTLSANQQIEIIEPVVVTLGPKEGDTVTSNIVNVYWVRNDDQIRTITKGGLKTLKFDWDEDAGTAYTLKENEYFFYTNKNKTDLAYYGNGTKIVKTGEIELVRDITSEESTSADEILQYGLAASIPWITLQLTTNKNISLHEYQYINVVKGQKVSDISFKESVEDKSKLEYAWKAISTAKYGDDDLTELQEIVVDDMS